MKHRLTALLDCVSTNHIYVISVLLFLRKTPMKTHQTLSHDFLLVTRVASFNVSQHKLENSGVQRVSTFYRYQLQQRTIKSSLAIAIHFVVMLQYFMYKYTRPSVSALTKNLAASIAINGYWSQ